MGEAFIPLETEPGLLIRARELCVAILDHPHAPAPEADAVLDLARRAGDNRAAAVLLNALAYSHRESLRPAKGLACADEALTLARRCGDVAETVRALVTRAMIRVELGAFDLARADLDAARQVGPVDPSLALAGAVVARHAGELPLARTLLDDLVSQSGLADIVRLKALNNLADVVMVEEPRRALALLDEAAALAPRTNALYGPVIALNRGLALAYAGDLPAALAALHEAGAGQGALHGGGLAAEYEFEVAKVLGSIRVLAEARSSAARALTGLAGAGGELLRADALMIAARLAVADGDQRGAGELLGAASALYAEQGRPAGVAIAAVETLDLSAAPDPSAYAGHAADLARLGLHREAARAWLAAAAAASGSGQRARARTFWQAAAAVPGVDDLLSAEASARVALAEGDAATARAHCIAGLEAIDTRAALATAPDLRHRIAADRIRFETMIRGLDADTGPARQLDALLRHRPPGHAPVAKAGPQNHRIEAGADRAGDLRAQWRELARRVESAEEDPQSLIALGAQLTRIETELRAGAWGTSGVVAGATPRGLDELAPLVGHPLLAIARIGVDAIGFWHEAGQTTSASLGDWNTLSDDFAQLSRALGRIVAGDASASVVAGARSLAAEMDAALAPLLAFVPTAESPHQCPAASITVLLDRGLESVPLGALPSFWERSVSVASLGITRSGSAILHDGPAAVRDSRPRVAIATGPGLEHADLESERVAAVWGDARLLHTAPDLLDALADCDIVHVAAHATLRWDNALQSVIHLHDGPLALTEAAGVTSSRAQAGSGLRLLYLASCSLASAPADAALPGAIPVLAETGVDTVIASSIPLPDAHSAWIAETVHAAVCRGESPAAGLAQARAQVDPGDPEHAVAWAALACLGAHTALP